MKEGGRMSISKTNHTVFLFALQDYMEKVVDPTWYLLIITPIFIIQ